MSRCCEDCALADGYGDCGCKPKRHEGVWECDCWEPLPPDEEETDGEEEMTNIEMVAAELEAAKKKHPKFVDRFSGYRGYALSVESIEEDLESERERLAIAVNKNRSTFRRVLACEVAEAIAAYAHGDLAHARQELAQCAAVCVRAMEYIEKEMEEEHE